MSDVAESLRAIGGPFDIILADPPWKFASNSAKKPGKNAMAHYDCMPRAEIDALPVKEIAAKDALLLMWVTVPFLEQAFTTARSWGFKYVSEIMWKKDRIGTGFWVRNKHEVVLVCKRGRFPCPKRAPFPDSVIDGQQRQHSRKPDRLHEMVNDVEDWRDLRKLEMFARESREGWTTWGNQTEKFDGPKALGADATCPVDLDLDDLLGPDPEIEDLLA
ncbi:MT-A70 family methyltransferase [Shimia sp.]|uniref:MT-A70 family methyltransferase n=1 Tax=Shimia sp. TaxID=1954381 RepID=UPI0032974508